jgi:tetratricopeptide (TPR) repeat protein
MTGAIESLLTQGHQARREHCLDQARAIYTEAVAWCREYNDDGHLAQSLTRLGGIERDLHKIDLSLRLYQEAVAIYRTLGDATHLAHTIRHVGDILRGSNQLVPALPCYEEALAIYRSHPQTNTLDLANTLRGFALLQAALGKPQEAIEMWKEAGTLYNRVWQEPGSPYKEGDLSPGIAESQSQIARLSTSLH